MKLREYDSAPETKSFFAKAMNKYVYNDMNNDSVLAAVKFLDTAIKMDRHYYVAYEEKANFLLVVKAYGMALKTVKEMIRMNPNAGELYRYEGILYYKSGEEKSSVKAFEKSLKLYEKELEIATIELDTMTVDTIGGIYSKGFRPWQNANWKKTKAIDDNAIGLALLNSKEGKKMLDSLSQNTDRDIGQRNYNNRYYNNIKMRALTHIYIRIKQSKS